MEASMRTMLVLFVLVVCSVDVVGSPRVVGVGESMLRLRSMRDLGDGRVVVSEGSGAWTESGVLTAWHVVDDATRVDVVDGAGVAHHATRWWRVGGQDVALVRLVKRLDLPMLPLGLRGVTVGTGLGVRAEGWGYWGKGMELGGVARVDGDLMRSLWANTPFQDGLGRGFYAWTAPVARGMSGGPVLVGGRVVGVVSHLREGAASYVAMADVASLGIGP